MGLNTALPCPALPCPALPCPGAAWRSYSLLTLSPLTPPLVRMHAQVLDYAFDRLALSGGAVSHPVVLTECPANPTYARHRMSELLFEAYGAPSVGERSWAV